MNLTQLEMELVTTTRLTRALWLALRGLAEDKSNWPCNDDMYAIAELALHVHKTAKLGEAAFFGDDTDKKASPS